MPKPKVRPKAAEKKAAKNHREASERTADKVIVSGRNRDWVPWVFIPLGLIGVAWLIVFYIAGYSVPFMAPLGNWNYLVGLGLIAAAFIVATLWE